LIQFLLAFHNHQPVGNFENVFREAFEKCYDPFLHFLEEHPSFRVTLHYSGCLLDWLEAREKPFLKRLERLVRKRQVELLGGGYYEPILPLIPEQDAVDQLQFMNRYLEQHFNQTPSGFWLSERVWEPKLPRIAAQAGLRYTTVDDTHFSLAGIPESEIKDFFVTEEEGCPLYLFPIPKELRYVIPFREPEETLKYLRKFTSSDSGTTLMTYADDGEKFGLWPGTYQWVFREGWLNRFAKTLEEQRSWIQLKTFSEVLEERKAQSARKVYLPSASYEEMAEWALSREKGREFLILKRELEATGLWARSRHFVQAGTFKNFLVKYPEADWMRSKMRWVSQKIKKLKKSSVRRKADLELWKGQCNCPYWHGVFGGLYLHHLRRSTYEHLIRAERLIERADRKSSLHLTTKDLNQDGQDEVIVEVPPFSFYLAPHRGGSLIELDYHPQAMNLLDTLARREEIYLEGIFQDKLGVGFAAKSIHEIDKTISPEVLERVGFDPHERFSCLDYFLDSQTTFEQYWKGTYSSLAGNPTEKVYLADWRKENGHGIFKLKGKQTINFHGKKIALVIEKKYRIKPGASRFTVSWVITNDSAEKIDCLWGSEWSFNFYDRTRQEGRLNRVEIQDGWSPVQVILTGEEPFDYWQFPVETVAQTEKDFRLLHQGISVFPHWRLLLASGQSFERSLCFQFLDGKNKS